MDWRQLLHNKWFVGGAIGVSAVGGYVLWQRKKTTGSSTSASNDVSQGSVAGLGGTFDSSSTDLAAALGDFEQAYGNQMADFLKQEQDILSKIPTGGSGGGTGGGTGGGGSGGGPVGLPSGEKFVTVGTYTSRNPPWNSTLSGIASHYHTTVANLLRLNPSIKNPNLIRTGQQIRYQ